MNTTIIDSTFLGIHVNASKPLHSKAEAFFERLGFKVKQDQYGVHFDRADDLVITPDEEEQGRTVQKEIEREEAIERMRPITASLRAYSKPWGFSFFGHHHEKRAQAVIRAIENSDPATAKKILTHQLALMVNDELDLSPVTNENIVAANILSHRWQTQVPGHRSIAFAMRNRSGYAKAISAALSTLSPDAPHVELIPPTGRTPQL
jgi:hypothetical protein